MNGVLKAWHPMVAMDLHDLQAPGLPPPPVPFTPYRAGQILYGLGLTQLSGASAPTHFGMTMKLGTDIGPFIPHLGAPNVLLPVILMTSGSKSYFGSQQYLVEGSPCACALLTIVGLNLNCGGPVATPPLPMGYVFALTSHMVDMTLGEIISGVAHMAFDAVLQTLLMKAFQWPPISEAVERFTQMVYERALMPVVWGAFERMGYTALEGILTSQLGGKGPALFTRVLQPLGATVIGWAVGSPVGFSLPYNVVSDVDNSGKLTKASAPWTDQGNDAIRDYVDSPSVPTHDMPPVEPDAGAEGASGRDASLSDGGAGSQSDRGAPLDQSVPAGAPDASAVSAPPDGPDAAAPVESAEEPAMSVDPSEGPNISTPGDVPEGPALSSDPSAEPAVSTPGDTELAPAEASDPSGAAGAPDMSVDPGQNQSPSDLGPRVNQSVQGSDPDAGTDGTE